MFSVILSIIWTIILLEKSECSEVVDGLDQKGIYISDYCPNIGSCPEGSHVMCMFYNPNSVMGPRCSNPQNISITPEIADKMLDITNAVRSKIALGKERGKDGNLLPRGYGMYRLKWDSELATFAQVLANQCVLRHDICRASKKFHDPGQTAGLVRFSNPLWRPVSPSVVFNTTGLTPPKVNYATTQSVKSWYSHKDHVTAEMIMNYPDWNKYGHEHFHSYQPHRLKKRQVYRLDEYGTLLYRHPENLRGRLYMEMISGLATHMGCGISAYSELAYHDNKADLTFNSIQTICNFSSRPSSGKPVYQTTQPTDPGYTVRCGCPRGYDEDDDCLCNEVPSPQETCGKKSCNPNVVLLPIFTVEDVPHNLLVAEQSQDEDIVVIPKPIARNNTESMAAIAIDDIFSPYETYAVEAVQTTRRPVGNPTMHHVRSRKDDYAVQVLNDPHYSGLSVNKISSNDYGKREQRLGNNKRRSMANRKVIDVKNRYFNKNVPKTSQHQTQSLQVRYGHVQNTMPALRMRSSIFSRQNTFHLPSDPSSFSFRANIRRDVAPRKDFTKGKLVLDSYLSKKRNHEELSNNALNIAVEAHDKRTINERPRFKVATKYLNPTKNFNRYLKNKFHYQDFNVSHQPTNGIDIQNSYEQADTKLMTLLDTLEQEVKHIELNGNKKELFDAKIRKIYDTVVHTSDLKSPLHARTKPDPDDGGYNNYVKSETDVTKHFTVDHVDDRSKSAMGKSIFKSEKNFNKINSKLSDRFSDPKSLFLKKTKAHNSLLPYEENEKALSTHYIESNTHDIYDTQIDDQNFANNNDRNEVMDKSMMRNSYKNKNEPFDVSQLKYLNNIREESDLNGRDITNNYLRNTDKRHDYDDYTNINRNPFNDNELKNRMDDKNDDYRDSEKRYDDEIKNRLTFRQPSLDLDLKNRDVNQNIDEYRHTKKRSSDDKIKRRNQLRQFLDKSLKNRNVYKKDGQIRHNYDDELIKRHNYDENLIELRRNENDMRRDINEFRSRMNDNEMRHANYKDYGHNEREISHNDAIGLERRKFYQSKLDNLERKLHSSRSIRRRSEREKERSSRSDRTNRDELHVRPSSKGQSPFYIPDRARILHGF